MDPRVYGPAVAALLEPERLPELGPGRPNEAARPLLAGLSPASLAAPAAVRDGDMARCCLAGLWLYHDFLDESHRISQEIATRSGSYWHALMHRREPDYGNAGYWFRRVGDHPVFGPLADAVRALPAPPEAAGLTRSPRWDPFAFVNLCAAAAGRGDETERFCRTVQLLEWRLLFDHCWRQATGAD
jgi:hypothetical protein